MIEKITYIKNLGVFKNFVWTTEGKSLCSFQKRNLIYGWNYSGKTTLSRIFSSCEEKENDCDFPEAKFELQDSQYGLYSNTNFSTSSGVIKTFNINFIKKNLQWDETINPIFILGQDSIILQSKIKSLKIEKENISTMIKETGNRVSELETNLNNGKADVAREIKHLLSISTSYDKRNVQQIIDSIYATHRSAILSDEEVNQKLLIYRNNERKNHIDPIKYLVVIDYQDLRKKIESLLNSVLTKNVATSIDLSPEKYAWVEKGYLLHKNETNCFFCGSSITEERWYQLNLLFSKENEVITNKIFELETIVQGYKINIPLPTLESFYKDYLVQARNILEEITKNMTMLNQLLDTQIIKLESKKTRLFEKIDIEFNIPTIDICEGIKNLNDLISINNDRTNHFDAEKDHAMTDLQNHFVADFIDRINLHKITDDISKLSAELISYEKNKQRVTKEIFEVDKLISSEVIGANEINDILRLYFGKNDIELEITEDKKYQLSRSGRIAKNLSEGEKTAIAFSYFLAKIGERDNKIDQTIVFIDDPISSLDANHLYNTFALIKNRLNKAKQLFISTHNYEFFKLLKDDSFFKEYKDTSKKVASYYLIRRIDNENSQLIDLPESLRKYSSEYQYLFSNLYTFLKQPECNDYYVYSVPNMARKLIEIYTSFKIPGPKITLDQRLSGLSSNEQRNIQIYKFINHLSHSDSLDFGIEFPSIQECKKVVSMLFELIKETDIKHFEGLKKIVE